MTTTTKPEGAMLRALQGLKALIINGDLSPGEQIRQEEMATQLNVSRVPLREAMNVLADQGLLRHRPHQGYFVAKRLPAENAQIRRMLQLLENELVHSLQWPDAAELERLRALNARMKQCVQQGDVASLIQYNRDFHFRIFSHSPNALILEEVRRLWTMSEPLMWNKYERAQDQQTTLIEHDSLIDALAARDRARFAREMEHHRLSPNLGLSTGTPGLARDD
jgi:DNA-binding GntR family transcriptional regulator